MEPCLVFVDTPLYIKENKNIDMVQEDLYDFHIEDSDSEKEYYSYCVLSIDVGVVHLGISVSLLDEEFNLLEIIWVDLIDITQFRHKYGPVEDKCQLYHTKTFCDWMNHTYQENIDFFEKADFILVERQPPQGFVVVEQLIMNRWRDKTVLVSPNSMHKYFGIRKLNYDKRKEFTEKIMLSKLKDKFLCEQLSYYDRIHDISDSICLMLYWIDKKQYEYRNNEKCRKLMERLIINKKDGKEISTETMFEKHRYLEKNYYR